MEEIIESTGSAEEFTCWGLWFMDVIANRLSTRTISKQISTRSFNLLNVQVAYRYHRRPQINFINKRTNFTESKKFSQHEVLAT